MAGRMGGFSERARSLGREKFGAYRRAGTVAVVLLVPWGAGFLGAVSRPPTRTVEAERFVLKDKTGAERAILGIFEDGSVGLRLTDTKGKSRVRLSVLEDYSARLELCAPNERNRVLLAYHEVAHRFRRDGQMVEERVPGCGLSLLDGHGDPRTELPRVQIGLGADGSPYIGLRSRDGDMEWRAPRSDENRRGG